VQAVKTIAIVCWELARLFLWALMIRDTDYRTQTWQWN